MTSGELGKKGEFLAEQNYLKDGYVTLEKNYKTRVGEIDLILTFASSVIFSEVKTRSTTLLDAPRAAVDKRKQGKIIRAAEEFLMNYPKWNDYIIRFDVVEVIYKNENDYTLNRLENAFQIE